MKKITKIVSVLAALAIAVLCCGCGGKSMTAQEGKLIMATNAEFPPYEYKEGDKIVGIDAEVAKLIAVNFSDSYATGVQVIIVKEDSDIKSKDDLEGKKIGAQQGTTGYIYASDTPENGGYGEENVTGYQNGALAVEALKGGKVDCVIIDNEPAKAYVAANEGLKILDTEYVTEDYAICFAKENTELQEKVNEALKALIEDGSVKKVVDKYIKAD